MSFGVLRRRAVGYKREQSGLSALQEPLLHDDRDDSPRSPVDDDGFSPYISAPAIRSKHLEHQAWHDNFVGLVAQWVAWFGEIMKGATVAISTLGDTVLTLLQVNAMSQIPRPLLVLTPKQEENLQKLKKRLSVPFNGSLTDHQDALKALWRAAFPEVELSGMISPQWKEMGWQGTDPSTDFRGGGFISLENLLNYAYKYPKSFRRILNKENGKRAEWEYPFAVAGLNLTFMLAQLLELRAENPSSAVGKKFVKILGENENAFDELYCVAFEMLDAQWLEMRASYMEFNAVLNTVKAQIQSSLLAEDIHTIAEIPSFQLLIQV